VVRRSIACSVALLALSACGDDTPAASDAGGAGDAAADAAVVVDVVTTMPDAPVVAPSAECRVTTWREPAGNREHRDPCTELAYPSHPPASGPHYLVWADFLTYADPVPWGFLVHSMEHGAVVLAYNCPSGCPDVIASFESLIADHGADPSCESHPTSAARFVVMPDPGLPEGSIAAVAWEHAYVATCLDEPSLRAFVDGHYGMAPEDLCAAGFDGSSPGWCD
jgi:hypothetical protein